MLPNNGLHTNCQNSSLRFGWSARNSVYSLFAVFIFMLWQAAFFALRFFIICDDVKYQTLAESTSVMCWSIFSRCYFAMLLTVPKKLIHIFAVFFSAAFLPHSSLTPNLCWMHNYYVNCQLYSRRRIFFFRFIFSIWTTLICYLNKGKNIE